MTSRRDEIVHHVNELIKTLNDAERVDYTQRNHKERQEELKVLMQHHAAVLIVGALSDLATIAHSLRTIAEKNSPATLISGDNS